MTWVPTRKSTPFKSGVLDIKGLRKRCGELGIRTFTGEHFPPPVACNVRAGKPAGECWCSNGDGTYLPCPPADE